MTDADSTNDGAPAVGPPPWTALIAEADTLGLAGLTDGDAEAIRLRIPIFDRRNGRCSRPVTP
jgi:hypothetical protein